MSDKPVLPSEQIPAIAGGISALASLTAPVIFAENAPCFGLHGSIVAVTLTTQRLMYVANAVVADHIVTAHLKLTIPGAEALIYALQQALLMGQPTDGPVN